MRKRREINVFSISFLDLLSGALGAVIILYVALPKNQPIIPIEDKDIVQEVQKHEMNLMREQLKRMEKELSLARAELSESTRKEIEKSPVVGGRDLDIGFKFKGKKIVFLIDTSYSMTEEDRMGQVKAGLKMPITSLSPEYQLEVVQYPLGERAPFKSLWGEVKNISGINKMDAFDFIYNLRPNGGTPTRDALLHILKNYEDISDIVLLSDGVPTLHNSNKKDDIYDIMKTVREENSKKVQINTIGVGSDFVKDKDNDRYKFLSLLSSDSGGFFVGF